MVVGDRAGSDVALHLNEAGQPLLALMEATEREQSETMAGGFGLPQHAPQPTPGTYSGPICSSTVPLGGKPAMGDLPLRSCVVPSCRHLPLSNDAQGPLCVC